MKDEVFVTGYAKLPQGITAREMYSVICVGILVDRESSKIVDAECSLVTGLAKRVFRELVVGKDLDNMKLIETDFNACYNGSAKKALISALRTCNEKYVQLKKGIPL